MRRFVIACLFLMPAYAGFAQTADDSLAFEVAAIKIHPPGDPSSKSTMEGGPGSSDPSRITAYNRMLRSLIIEAYGIRNFQIEHPDWVGDARYDIVAKVPPGTTKPQSRIMMRNLLRDRFQLRIRRESKIMPVYALALGKSAPKMKLNAPPEAEVQADGTHSEAGILKVKTGPKAAVGIFTSYEGDAFKAAARGQSMAKLVTWLTTLMDRPVMDSTRLKGDFDFDLAWHASSGSPADVSPEIVDAVQRQIGLKLEPRKMPIPIIVVESALKVPIEN